MTSPAIDPRRADLLALAADVCAVLDHPDGAPAARGRLVRRVATDPEALDDILAAAQRELIRKGA